jgi:GT2 family glycosyltransferase
VPNVSVIIPAFRAQRTLAVVLEALEAQVAMSDREVVLIDSGGAAYDSAAVVQRKCSWLRVISSPERMLPGQARNLGVSVAHGELLAFLDADTIPQLGWLDALEGALGPGVEMVAGAVLDGTPHDHWGSIGYILEFMEWLPERRAPLSHAAGCNLLVRRASLERVGGFPEDMWPGEDTVLTAPFAARGTLVYAPAAQVIHLNRVSRREVLTHQRRLGASWVQVCARVPMRGNRLAVPRLAPIAVAGRILSLIRQSRCQPGATRRLVSQFPLLLVGLMAWGAGVLRPLNRSWADR